MKEVVKQRLVGALILVALGVIFWPIIFVDPDTDIDIQGLQVPPRPERGDAFAPDPEPAPMSDRDTLAPLLESDWIPEMEPDPLPGEEAVTAVPEEQTVAVPAEQPLASPDSAAQATLPQPGETREAAMAAPQMDDQGLPVVWTLQVVTLSDGIKAEALRQELLSAGHKAYVKAVTVEDKTLYRVHVGPKAERAQLEALQAELDQRLGVKSMVRRYLP